VSTPEKKVKDKVKRVLAGWGIYYFMPATHGYGSSGVPDLIACRDGLFIGIECKANGGKATTLQLKNLGDIVAAGGVGILVDETGLDAFELAVKSASGGEFHDLLAK
tara:strand:+ start:1968 stop:2288 length:321 start_codon:yes stop_codon:yes gene_type:complete